MTELFVRIYNFFKRRRPLRNLLMLLSTAVFLYFGLQVTYEEDISKLLPSTTDESSEQLAFSNLRVKDKIFVLFAPRDSAEVDPDMLVEMSDSFVDSLVESDTTGLIADVLYKIDEDLIMDAMGFMCDNVALFTDSVALAAIDTLTTPESISRCMSDNYENLTSAAGIAFRQIVACDPIGLRNVLLGRFVDVKDGLGGSMAMYDSHFFTPDTTVGIAYISPSFKSFDSKSGIALVELIERQVEKFSAEYPDVEILCHGAPIQSVYNSRQIKKDLALTVGISLVVICLIIGYCFRNKMTLVQLLCPVFYGTFFSLTIIYFIKGSMSLMALGIGSIVLGVALSYCLHVITHYKYVSTPTRVLRDQTVPVFLGCLTTIGSFLGLMFTKSDLLKDFGLFASFAMVGTTFFCLVFLPHFFSEANNRRSKKAFAWLERFNSFPFERQKWLIVLILVVCACCFYTSRWVTFDSNLRNIGYYEPKVTKSMNLLASKTLPGYNTTYYAAESRILDSALVISRSIVAKLDSFRTVGKIRSVSKSSRLFLTTSEQRRNIELWKSYWTPEKVSDVRRNIYESGRKYGFKPELFDPFVRIMEQDYVPQSLYTSGLIPDGLLANMVECTDGHYMVFASVQVRPEDSEEVGKAVDSISGALVVDPFFYTSEMVKSINSDFNVALLISSLFVFVVLLISYRNLILALLAFTPMSLSWFVVLGVMGMFGLQFNLINIVISTFIFGIGVDYSIFVMDGLLSKARSETEPLLLTYHKTAIFFSAAVLIVGTGSLLFAKHPALASIGITTLIGMSTAVLIAYTLQPFLYHLMVRFMIRYNIRAKWLGNSRRRR